MSVTEEYYINLWQKKRLFKLEKDRFKEKKYVYISFPITNTPTIYPTNTRGYIYYDIYSRYLRNNGYNVLNGFGYNDLALTAYIESKKNRNTFDLELSGIKDFQEVIKNIGIGFDISKEFKTNSLQYIKFIQQVFIYLYKNKKIQYKKTNLLLNENTQKIYNIFETKQKDLEYYDEYSDEHLVQSDLEVLVLDITKYLRKIQYQIERLDLEDEYKEKLINTLKPYEGINIKFYLEETTEFLKVFIKNPEFIAGISFISLNPNLIDINRYINESEKEAIRTFLNNHTRKSLYSGITLRNPLNNNDIPLFISNDFNEDIHVGIPSINEEDYRFATKNEIGFINVLKDEIIINSDFITGLNQKDARNKIIEEFISEDMAEIEIRYDMSEIIISSLDNYGALIPLFKNINENEIFIPDKNIPIYISSKFRQHITDIENISSDLELFKGSLNSLFSSGLASLFMKYFDSKIATDFPFEQDHTIDKIDLLIIKENELYKEVLMPIIFNEIFKDFLNIDYIGEIKKIIIEKKVFDSDHLEIKKINDNIFFLKNITEKYSVDAFRLYMICEKEITEELDFNLQNINQYQTFVNSIKRLYSDLLEKDNLSIEPYLLNLKAEVSKNIINFNFKEALNKLINFYKDYLINEKLSTKQSLDYLIMLSIFIPFTSESIYQSTYGNNSSFILFEVWPNN